MDFKPESIVQLMTNYENLMDKLKHIIGKTRFEFDDIEGVSIETSTDGATYLHVSGGYYCRGEWCYEGATIPIEWVAMSDEELKEAIEQQRIKEEEERRKYEEAEEKKKAEMEEKREREIYERLKKKYEGGD